MTATVWHQIGRQFRHPQGIGGRLIGAVMGVINRRPNRFALDALAIAPDDVVLELGCGPGLALVEASERAWRGVAHGLDFSETMLAQALAHNATAVRTGRVVLHRGSFERIPLGDASVDKILAVNVVYFWQDWPAILTELRRVLRPNGRIAIYATDASIMRRWKFASAETHRLFDAASLGAAAESGPFAPRTVSISRVNAGAGVPGLIAVIHDKPLGKEPSDEQLNA